MLRILTFLGLLSLFPAAARAADLANSFQEAAARGDAQERAAATKEYFAKTLMPYYGKTYAPVLQSCFTKVPNPDSSRFSFVVAIGADGQVVRLYRDRETNIFKCMRATLEKDLFPGPPVSPYYLHIQMEFSGGDAAQDHSNEDSPPLVLEPNKYSYTFRVPKGWESNFQQAQQYGVRLMFFPKGGNFETSKSVIYIAEANEVCEANCVGKLSRAIAKELQESRDGSPSLQVAIEHPLKIEEGGEAPVRILTGAKDPRRAKEALAFIEHNEAIVLVVLTTMDTKTWEQDYRAFQEIVSGHKFFACGSAKLATPCR